MQDLKTRGGDGKKREFRLRHYPSPGWNLGMNICFIYGHCFNSSSQGIVWSVKFKLLEKYDSHNGDSKD